MIPLQDKCKHHGARIEAGTPFSQRKGKLIFIIVRERNLIFQKGIWEMEAEYRSTVKQLIEELGKKDHFLAIWTKGSFKKRKNQNKTNCVRVYKMRYYLVRDMQHYHQQSPSTASFSTQFPKQNIHHNPQIHDTPKGRRDQVSIQVDARLNRVGSWRLGCLWYLSDLICEWSLLTLSRKKINK